MKGFKRRERYDRRSWSWEGVTLGFGLGEAAAQEPYEWRNGVVAPGLCRCVCQHCGSILPLMSPFLPVLAELWVNERLQQKETKVKLTIKHLAGSSPSG